MQVKQLNKNLFLQMNLINIFGILMFWGCYSCKSFAITLNEALEYAYKNNVALKSDREVLKAKDEEIMQIIARMLPSISISKEKLNIKQTPTDESQEQGYKTEKTSGLRGHLVLSQNIYRGGSDFASLTVARNSIEAARAELKDKEQRMLLSVVESFFKLKALNDKYCNAKEMEQKIKKYMHATEQRFKAGTVTRTDVARIQAAYASSKAKKSQYWSEFISEKTKFKNLIGLDEDITVQSESKQEVKIPSTVDEAVAIALKNNPQIHIGNFSKRASAENVKVHMGSLLPTIDLKHQVDDLTHASLRSSDRGLKLNQVTSLEVTIPIFDGGNRWSKVRAAKNDSKRIEYNVMNIYNEVSQAATKAWSAVTAEKEILKSREESLKASKVTYEGAKAEEEAGIRASIDVIEAYYEYFQSYDQYIDAKTNYWLSLYSLKMVLGECTAEGLKLKVKVYDPLANYNKIKFQLIGAY
jgi:outer membrane protein